MAARGALGDTGAARGAVGDTGSTRGTIGGPGAARGATAGNGAALVAAGITGTVPVYRENLQGKDRQEKVAEPPSQSETETPARGQEKVWRRWIRGNPTHQR